jgi:predicted ArsR family transcriptional regulator
MKKSLILGAGRGPRLAVLELLKRSGQGMSVQELAAALDMSYMGVKAHCLALVTSGHLIGRREPTTKGRPRLLYKLTDSGELLFAEKGTDLALELLREAATLYGTTAPQKLLLKFYRSLQGRYRELIMGESVLERARTLVRLRDAEGRMSLLLEGASWEIHESHNPFASIMEAYPEACGLEEHALSEVLGTPVRRRQEAGKVIIFPIQN